MKPKFESRYQGAFVFGALATWAMVDPFIPVLLRVALIPFILLGTSLTVTDSWFRYFGRRVFREGSRWGQTVEGIAAGTATSVLILTVLWFYFHVPISIPSL